MDMILDERYYTKLYGDGHGFFWWGGYGISTEHTAYENLQSWISSMSDN